MFISVLQWLFDPAGLTPHGFCLLWQPGLIALHAGADLATGIAYFSIPLAMAVFAGRRRDLAYPPVVWLFIAFILLCGATHFMGMVTLWVPAYAFQGVLKAMTALVSLATAVTLWVLMPRLLALPSSAQLQQANEALQAANAALRESQAHYRASFEQSPVAMHMLDSRGTCTDVSNSWMELFGYSRAEIVGRHLADITAPDAESWVPADRARLMETGEVRDMDRRFLHRDGHVIEALVSARTQRLNGQVELVCVVQDVTERRRAEAALRDAEERLHHSQKMEAIGQLTGGVAHDFNNMLQGVGGCLDMMERRVAQGRAADIARYLPPARHAIDRASHLTNRMLAFARRQTLLPRLVDPDELIRGMEELIRRTLGPSVAITLDLNDGAWLILCDPHQLESALLNVAINARDAMPEGGSLRIATHDFMLGPDDTTGSEDAAPGPYVTISLTDTGTGMSPAIRERIFDPFFTTKPIGQGTGLGLSQLYGFVRQSGGFVRAESALGQGTTITIHLPREAMAAANPAGTLDAEASPATPDAKAEGARVLLVEDDAQVRAVISEVLHDLGCTVLEASDGTAGWQIAQSSARIDLLVTDVGLPGMNGRQLADAARGLRPDLKVLIITGYAGTALADLELPAGMMLLRKPFTLDELSAGVAMLRKDAVRAVA